MSLALAPLTTSTPALPAALASLGNDPQSRAGGRAGETASGRAGEALAQAGSALGADQEKESSLTASERVSVTPVQDEQAVERIFAAPFAEIWKDGRKLAEVDARGEVRGYGGVLAPLPSGGSGLAVAATRAAVLAQSLGGEIRSSGVLTDARTLTMRSRLQTAYTPAG